MKRGTKKNHLNKLYLGIGCGFVALSAAIFYVIFIEIPNFNTLRNSVRMKIRLEDGRLSTRQVGPKAANWVSLNEISTYLILAVVASEDASFFQHEGVDFFELKEAIKKDIKERRFARGASTISQQVIKNAFLSHEKTLKRKFKEFFWAREMEKELSKREILSFYLNMVEWGPGLYGIKAASWYYFGVPPSYLTAKQGAFLAFLLPAPRTYHSYFAEKKLTAFANKQVRRILRAMKNLNFINLAEYREAMKETLFAQGRASNDVSY